ncbi:hypothetical protein RDWZM_006953 [Blomia tropicalis]|uniref:Phosphopantothenoylcysteine decarboxylase n=1 Tax=Blomia tropicalis TaxID=40697 RepID=A0A9Q0RPS1_BLOTA|nr:hypothetical protein RDWZM_006953 [Blomia tropicalis]
MPNILVLVTGSVAAIKLPLLIDKLYNLNRISEDNIRVVLTEPCLHFFDMKQVESKLLSGSIYRDADEWNAWKRIGDPVIHIDLRSWADIGIIAPLDANTMGKIANGICDNLVTCIIRAWDMSKPLLFAPAMNVHMWNHPLTNRSISILRELGYIQIGPISKKLACGDIGMGAMAEVDQIVEVIQQQLNMYQDNSKTQT